ncbi:MAG: glycosyltransferase family 2 protein [Candidatus Eisenbacteria bacterium]
MQHPPVWAVVVNWNGLEVVEPCLRTLLASSYPNLSVLVVDNASSDGSAHFVREEFPSVRVAEQPSNRGYAAGVNAGLTVALDGGAEYVLLLNNDIELDAGAVSALVDVATAHPQSAFVGPMIYYADRPNVIWSAGGAVSFWSGGIRHLGLREEDVGQYAGVREVDYVTACAVLASASAVRKIGPMDESYYMYNEDTDWCVRARSAGFTVLVAPTAKIWHKVSMSSGGGLTPFRIYNRLRSTLRFFSLHARPYHWLGILPLTACRTVGFAARELVGGRGGNVGAVLRGLWDSITRRRRA